MDLQFRFGIRGMCMWLERLSLLNFRCFKDITIEFDKRLTVIVAENGLGKTAILDAIAIGFGRYLTKLPDVKGRTTTETDVRLSRGEQRERVMAIHWEARTADNEVLAWSSTRRAPLTRITFQKLMAVQPGNRYQAGAKDMDEFTRRLVESEDAGDLGLIPVIAYYGTNRAIREDVKRRRNFKKQFERFAALEGALDPDSRFRAAFEWFNALEDEERRERAARRSFKYVQPELEAVRRAMIRMLPGGFSNPRTEIRPLRFVIDRTMPDGATTTFRISQLSDGYRVVLGLVMDLARRLAQANGAYASTLKKRTSVLDLPAIALIDEVDLHLHPVWQQIILTDLMRTFPCTQFIVTTHSPQVLSTVKRDNIRIIAPDQHGNVAAMKPLGRTYGRPSGDVMHSVMLVDPQPPINEKADLEILTALVDQGKSESKKAKDLMDTLVMKLGEEHPQLQRLQRSILRKRMLKA